MGGRFPVLLVSSSTRDEIERFSGGGEKQVRILKGWTRLSDAQDDWSPDSFGRTAPGPLNASLQLRPNPLILHGLGVATADEIVADSGPLSAFPHQGDRALILDALLSGVPAILTTDLRSFWAHREALYAFGLEVWRPSDALSAYEPRWARRRSSPVAVPSRMRGDGGRAARAVPTPPRFRPPRAVRRTEST